MSENGNDRCWDHEDCPHDWCEGELQQQDRINVMCLDCEGVWSHVRQDATVRSDPPAHQLQGPDGRVWAEMEAVTTDGGIDPSTTETEQGGDR